MRIIAGTRARITILGPRDRTTRPVTDRVKESLFSILADDLAEARVADLFCGTGSMGLEALSRGAAWAIMADKDRDALQRLHKNIAKLGFEDRAVVRRVDIFRQGIPDFGKNLPEKSPISPADDKILPCNLVFLDPPYILARRTGENAPLARLMGIVSGQVEEGALVVVRNECRYELLPEYGGLRQIDRRVYNNMAITFFER